MAKFVFHKKFISTGPGCYLLQPLLYTDVELRAKEERLPYRADVNYRIIDPNLH